MRAQLLKLRLSETPRFDHQDRGRHFHARGPRRTLHPGLGTRRSVQQQSTATTAVSNAFGLIQMRPGQRKQGYEMATAWSSGRRGRRFKSCHPDHVSPSLLYFAAVLGGRAEALSRQDSSCRHTHRSDAPSRPRAPVTDRTTRHHGRYRWNPSPDARECAPSHRRRPGAARSFRPPPHPSTGPFHSRKESRSRKHLAADPWTPPPSRLVSASIG